MGLNWKSVLEGKGEWSLAELQLANGRGITCKGQGVLRWARGEGPTIEAFTDGAEALFELFRTDPCRPGQLYPADWYLRLDATTITGVKVQAERIVPNAFTISGVDKPVFWSIPARDFSSSINFTYERTSPDQRTTSEVVIHPNHVRPWRQFSTATDDNPRFGVTTNDRDWLQFNFSGGDVAVRAAGELLRVKIAHTSVDPTLTQNAVNLALSFAFGKISRIDATQTSDPTKQVGQLALPRTVNRSSFPSPVGGSDAVDSEKLLAACADLFVNPECPHTAHIYACLESSVNSLASHAVVLCASLEAILTSIAGNVDDESALSDDQQMAILDAIKQQGTPDQIVIRVSGVLTSFKNVRVKDILTRWATNQLLGVTPADLTAWNKIRHAVAHGGLLQVDNATIQARYRLQNLVNKCILQAAGYEGQYMDYVSWSHEAFPLADPAALQFPTRQN